MSLSVNYAQMTNDSQVLNLQKSQLEDWGGVKKDLQLKYEQSQISHMNQLQVRNNLLNQIIQTKKSLNLLKGDIGHLIGRNQSASLLSSKMSKVKIVADDQLKRVSVAFVKDRNEIKERNQMQKQFSKKLKGIENFEQSTLGRLKNSYLSSMVQKKEVHNRLNWIEKISASINQSSDKENLKNMANLKTVELYVSFVKLENMIGKVAQFENRAECTAEQIHKFTDWLKNEENYNQNTDFAFIRNSFVETFNSMPQCSTINSIDLQMITSQKLLQLQTTFQTQHQRMAAEIQKRTSEYDILMKRRQEILVLLEQCDCEIQKIERNLVDQIGTKLIVTSDMREEYNKKLKKLNYMLKTIFFMLEFVERIINYSSITVPIKPQSDKVVSSGLNSGLNSLFNTSQPKSQINILGFKNQLKSNSILKNDKSLAFMTKNYISELYKTYYQLLRQEQWQPNRQSIRKNSIYEDLQQDLQKWLTLIKDVFMVGNKSTSENLVKQKQDQAKKQVKILNPILQVPRERDQLATQKSRRNIDYQDEEIANVMIPEKISLDIYKRHSTTHQHNTRKIQIRSLNSSSESERSRENLTNQASSITKFNSVSQLQYDKNNLVNIDKLRNYALLQQKQHKANRIRLLESIDQDYYKMLKSTLKMQKQNTRKNYDFSRNFKRTKYSNKDQLLQEKRFQCGFSVLFANKRNQIIESQQSIMGKKSNFFKNSMFEKQVVRLNQSRKLLESSNLIKSNLSVVNVRDNSVIGLKENIKNMKDRVSKSNHLDRKKLSVDLKCIVNLV